jgi:hypothetical protein
MAFGLRRLLLLFTLPALLLPEGVTLCLCQLIGEHAVRASCARCCCCDDGDVGSGVHGRTDCWLTTPSATRDAQSSSQKTLDESISAAAAPALVAIAPDFGADLLAPFAWRDVRCGARALHPPPIAPLSLPLRL